jgi:hypothetical protein
LKYDNYGFSFPLNPTALRNDFGKFLDKETRNPGFPAYFGLRLAKNRTFLNLVSGIDPPDSSKIIINGTDITGLFEHDRTLFLRHHIRASEVVLLIVPMQNIFNPVRKTALSAIWIAS